MTDLTIQQSARHAVFVQRFAGFVANQFDPYLNRLQRELKIIMSDAPTETTNIRLINRIIADYRRESLDIYTDYNADELLAQLSEFAEDEAAWQAASLDTAIVILTCNPGNKLSLVLAPFHLVHWHILKYKPGFSS